VTKSIAALWPLREVNFTRDQMEEEGVYLTLAGINGILPPQEQGAALDRVQTLYRISPTAWRFCCVCSRWTRNIKILRQSGCI